ncbi:adenylyl cyclase-associated protein 2-like isoform X2 [Artemia franciscana]|uniref:adenylyl cyclase-associated protein 2-like isoform X2 n=1 Tax=Artemia franciscana TaxID=6661 RepID=UPI0032DB993B
MGNGLSRPSPVYSRKLNRHRKISMNSDCGSLSDCSQEGCCALGPGCPELIEEEILQSVFIKGLESQKVRYEKEKVSDIYCSVKKKSDRRTEETKRHQKRITFDESTCVSPPKDSLDEVAPNVIAFDTLLNGPLKKFVELSNTIGGDVSKVGAMVFDAFNAERGVLVIASKSKQPSQEELVKILAPVSELIQSIQDFREKNRKSAFFNHLSAISEGIPALGWVAVTPAPAPYVKEMNDAGQFYTNRVLKDWKEKDKTHVDWVKVWIQTLNDLQAYVKQHHTTGLMWNPSGKSATASVPSVQPKVALQMPGPPPPPPMGNLDLSTPKESAEDARNKLFSELNKGEAITSGLKKVTQDMQTHKNPSLRSGPAPFKAAPLGETVSKASLVSTPTSKPPKMELDGKKWIVEYQKNQSNLVITETEMNQVVYIFKCENSTIQVKGKINSIVMDSCKRVGVVFDSVVSSMEFVNCQSTQMQVTGVVPTISIDKTDGCQIYLSKDSLNVVVVSSKSSEMNILVPKDNGDYVEYALPEQYRTTFNGTGLTTVVSDIA